jgi:arsenical-resistance protein 2
MYTLSCRLIESSSASSRGRGPRAAGWFADYLLDRGNTEIQSLVLAEGIKGWAGAGEEYVTLMDDYEEAVWRQ